LVDLVRDLPRRGYLCARGNEGLRVNSGWFAFQHAFQNNNPRRIPLKESTFYIDLDPISMVSNLKLFAS
jgi:hypothetical protein